MFWINRDLLVICHVIVSFLAFVFDTYVPRVDKCEKYSLLKSSLRSLLILLCTMAPFYIISQDTQITRTALYFCDLVLAIFVGTRYAQFCRDRETLSLKPNQGEE